MYTDHIPQIDKIREFHLLGIASMFPYATEEKILRWFIVQKLIFNPAYSLKVYDDLIASKLIHREIIKQRCSCGNIVVYKLTEAGQEKLREILN